jgi:peptidoglycan/LPS O-acetylase OafA/YrhL
MNNRPAASNQTAPGRFNEIDLFRAIACLMVVAFHYLHRGALEGWSPPAEPGWLGGVAQYGYLGVHLFFIISGFVIFLSAHGATPLKFFASRVSRLYPAFWVAVVLTWLVVLAFDAQALQVSASAMLLNLTMLPHWFGVPYVDGAYWSLAVELQFYILVWLVLRFKWMAHVEYLLAAWLGIAAINALRPMYPVEFWLAANWAPLFCVGAAAYLIRMEGMSKARLALFGFAYVLALFYAVNQVVHPKGGQVSLLNPWLVGALVSGFVALFALIALGRIQSRRHPWIVMGGMLTYPVYLLHENIGYVLMSFLSRQGLNFMVNAVLMLCVVGLLAWLVNRYVERPWAPHLKRLVADGLDRRRSA